MKKISYLIIIIVLVSISSAQSMEDRMPNPTHKAMGLMNFPNPQMQDRDDMHERMEMMMTWKLTNDLDLTPEQADKFFPRMKEHRKNMQKIDKDIVAATEAIRKKVDDEKEISEKELNKVLVEVIALEKQQVDERNRFFSEVKDILDTTQRAKLAIFKQSFMKDLRKQIRKRPQGRS